MNSIDDFNVRTEIRCKLRIPVQIQDRLCFQQTEIRTASGQRPRSACCFSFSKEKTNPSERTVNKNFAEAFKKLQLHDKIQWYCECVDFLDRLNRSVYTYSIELPNQPLTFEAYIMTNYHLVASWTPCFIELWSSPPILSLRFAQKLVPYDLHNYIVRKSQHKGKYSCIALQPTTDAVKSEVIRIGFVDQEQCFKAHHIAKLIVIKAHQQNLLNQMGLQFKQYKTQQKQLNIYTDINKVDTFSGKESLVSSEIENYLENLQKRNIALGKNADIAYQSMKQFKQNKPHTANNSSSTDIREIQSAKGTAEMFRAKNKVDSGMSTNLNSKQNSYDQKQLNKAYTAQNPKNMSHNCPRPPQSTNRLNLQTVGMPDRTSATTLESYKTAEPAIGWDQTSIVISNHSHQRYPINPQAERRRGHKNGISVRPSQMNVGSEFKPGTGLNVYRIAYDQNEELGLKEVGDLLHEQLVSGRNFVNEQYKKLDPMPVFSKRQIERNHILNVRRQSNEKLLKDQYQVINGKPTHPSRLDDSSSYPYQPSQNDFTQFYRPEKNDTNNKNTAVDPLKKHTIKQALHQNDKLKDKSKDSVGSKNAERVNSLKSPKYAQQTKLRIADILSRKVPGQIVSYDEDD